MNKNNFYTTNKNPIFVQFYIHDNCDCYKILNPFTKYRSETIVLCKVSEGYEKARTTAIETLHKKLVEATDQRNPIDVK